MTPTGSETVLFNSLLPLHEILFFFKLDWKSPNSFCGHERTLNHVPGMSGDVQSQTEMLVCLLKPTLHIFIFLFFLVCMLVQTVVSVSFCLVLACKALRTPSAPWRNAAKPGVPIASSDQFLVLIGQVN